MHPEILLASRVFYPTREWKRIFAFFALIGTIKSRLGIYRPQALLLQESAVKGPVRGGSQLERATIERRRWLTNKKDAPDDAIPLLFTVPANWQESELGLYITSGYRSWTYGYSYTGTLYGYSSTVYHYANPAYNYQVVSNTLNGCYQKISGGIHMS